MFTPIKLQNEEKHAFCDFKYVMIVGVRLLVACSSIAGIFTYSSL